MPARNPPHKSAKLRLGITHHVLVQVAVREHDLAQLLHLILVGRVPDLPGREERLNRVVVAFLWREDELLMRADDAVVERRAGDDFLVASFRSTSRSMTTGTLPAPTP